MSRAEDTRFDSWKEIATYLGRDIRTAMRWEEERALPVHRVPGGGRRAVHAYRSEIDAWLRDPSTRQEESKEHPSLDPLHPEIQSPQNSQFGGKDHIPTEVVFPTETGSHLPRPSSKPQLKTLGIAGLAAFAVVLLATLIIVSVRGPRAEDTSSGVPAVPSGVEHWLRLSLVNGQPENVPGSFQQYLVVDSARYAAFEAENLQNVEFFDIHGKLLRSWLESGNSKLSTHTVYWIQLPDGMPASKVINVYMGFVATSRNVLNAVTTGEAPELSPNYGEYDSGGSVFARYANFVGNSLPPGWYSGLTPGGKGEVRVQNGVFMSHSGRGGGSAFLGSDWAVGGNITEMDLLSQQTLQGQEMIFVCSTSPTQFRWTPDSVGYQDMSGLEIENNDSGTPSVLAIAIPNPTQSSVIGFQEGTLFANYLPVAHVRPRICGGDYLASSVNSGLEASFSFDWARMRVPPPNGVMPTAIFGESK